MPWTVEQLVEACARALAGEAQPSGRVNDAPDLRTIRYYASLGLLDAPRSFDGKKGLYDERHLHQLLAVKRLQRGGLALADIQRQLAGATDARLRALAQVDVPLTPRFARLDPARADAPRPPTRERFWARRPHVPPPVEAFRVAPGITVIVDGAPRAFTDDDVRALRTWLAERGLAEEEA